MKLVKHEYKGYTIVRVFEQTPSKRMLGGRCWSKGSTRKNYNIYKDGVLRINRNVLFETLKEVKEFINETLIR